MRLLIAAALAAFSLPDIALAAPNCAMTPDAVTTKLLRRFPHLHVANMAGEGAKAFLVAFNALSPATNYVADQVLVFDEAGRSTAEVVLFVHRCMTQHGEGADLIEPHLQQGS
jgi:hypothetical protein